VRITGEVPAIAAHFEVGECEVDDAVPVIKGALLDLSHEGVADLGETVEVGSFVDFDLHPTGTHLSEIGGDSIGIKRAYGLGGRTFGGADELQDPTIDGDIG
jgi:hypothetical protein